MNHLGQRFRTVSGQLTLLGLTFACTVILGIVIICLRELVFERYARESYAPLADYAVVAGSVLTNPESSPEQIDEVGRELEKRSQSSGLDKQRINARNNDLERLYGAWISDESFDPGGYLAKRLTGLQPTWIFRRLRGTLVAGSHDQQARALVWLRIVAGEDGNTERIEELAVYARRKAERRGDWDIQQLADAVLAVGRPRGGVQ